MATDVGPVSVRMSASPEGLAAGLATAENMVAASGQKMAAESDKAGSKLAASLTNKLSASGNFLNKTLPEKVRGGVQASYGAIMSLEGSLEKALKDPGKAAVGLVGGIGEQLARIPALGGVLALPFEGVAAAGALALAAYAKGSDSIRELGKAAAKTGVEVSDFQVFALVAGDMSLAEKAIFKFQQKLADAQLAAVGTSDAFTRLGLDGRAIAELAQGSFSSAYGKVADRIRELPGAMLQAKAAFDLFGKSGFQMLPSLLKGSDEIEKMRKNLAKFGGGVNAADVANVKQADLSKKLVGAFVGGFSVEVAKAVAPGLAALSQMIAENMTGFGGLSEKIVDWVGSAGSAVAMLADAFQSGQLWETLSANAQMFFGKVMGWLGLLLDRIPDLEAKLKNAFDPLAAFAPGGAGGAGAKVRELLGTGGPSDGLGGDLAAQAARMQKEAAGRLEDVNRQIAEGARRGGRTWGQTWAQAMDAWKKRMTDFGKGGASDLLAGILPRLEALSDKAKPVGQDAANLLAEANAVSKALDAVAKKEAAFDAIGAVGRHAQFLEGGPAAGNLFADVAARAAFAGFEQLKGAVKIPEARFAGAMQSGSREAYSLIQAWKANPQLTVEEQMRQILEEQKRLQEEQNRIGREALDAFRKLKPDLAGIGG